MINKIICFFSGHRYGVTHVRWYQHKKATYQRHKKYQCICDRCGHSTKWLKREEFKQLKGYYP